MGLAGPAEGQLGLGLEAPAEAERLEGPRLGFNGWLNNWNWNWSRLLNCGALEGLAATRQTES